MIYSLCLLPIVYTCIARTWILWKDNKPEVFDEGYERRLLLLLLYDSTSYEDCFNSNAAMWVRVAQGMYAQVLDDMACSGFGLLKAWRVLAALSSALQVS